MEIETYNIDGVTLLIPRHIGDERGYFAEIFRADIFAQHVGDHHFVQNNESRSAAVDTIRGLHFQSDPHAQSKLVHCTADALFDGVVDIRQKSPTYGQWVSETLNPDNGSQLSGIHSLSANCGVDGSFAGCVDGGLARPERSSLARPERSSRLNSATLMRVMRAFGAWRWEAAHVYRSMRRSR